MSLAARTAFRLQRLVGAIWPLSAIIAGIWFLCTGRFTEISNAGIVPLGVAAILLLAVVVRGLDRYRVRFRSRRRRAQRMELEIGLSLLVLCEVALQATGGSRSAVAPILFVATALLVFFNRRSVGAILGASAAALDLGVAVMQDQIAEPQMWLRIVFLVVFAALAFALLQLEAFRRRREHAVRMREELRSLEDEARDYRLIGTALGPESRARSPQEEGEKRLHAAAYALRDSIYHVLELTHCALRPHTTILLWLDANGQYLKIKELISASDQISERPLRAGEGVLGGIIKRLVPVNLVNLRDGSRLPYYRAPLKIRSFLGVPVMEGGVIRGILAVDRMSEFPFDETDELFLGHAAQHVVRAIESERVLARVDQAKQVQERFYRASESFREAVTPDDVYRVTSQAACDIAPWDFAAITLCDEGGQVIAKVFGEGKDRLEGQHFGRTAGLCTMVVKNRHELPLHGQQMGKDVQVFSAKLRVRNYESLLVLPLVARAEVLGTLVLASKQRGAFSTEARDLLRVVASQAAGSLEHAQAYSHMETLATTDGLTGLLNHRHFQDRLSDLLARAERHGKQASLILTDIDHFKSINDTYGHPVGDMVLREVAQILAESVRKIDIVARYGGEEFALVLEETDADGAMGLAERVRSEVASRIFHCDQGNFRVTLSLGVAVFPDDSKDKHGLIDRADQALYSAKRGGRNRTVLAPTSARTQAKAG